MYKLCDLIYRKVFEACHGLITSKRHILTVITIRISKMVSDFFILVIKKLLKSLERSVSDLQGDSGLSITCCKSPLVTSKSFF